MAGTGAKLNTKKIDGEIARLRAQIKRAADPPRRRIEQLQVQRKDIRKRQRLEYMKKEWAWLKKEPLVRTNADTPPRRNLQHQCSYYSYGDYPAHGRRYLWRCENSGTVEHGGLHFCRSHIWETLRNSPFPDASETMDRLATPRKTPSFDQRSEETLRAGKAYGSAI